MSTVADVLRVEEALRFIPAHDRDTWVKMGMAVKSELGDAGFEIWDSWSKTANNYSELDAKTVWRSITCNGGVTVGTLFHEAQQHSFQFNAENGSRTPPPNDFAERERKALDAEAEKEARQAKAATVARAIWEAAKEAPNDHPYLAAKGIAGHGLRLHNDGRLLVPIWSNAVLQSLQFIAFEGNKRFLPDGRVKGCYLKIGMTDSTKPHCICEGYATGSSLHRATGYPVVVAFNAGNLESVALVMRKEYPQAKIIICADNDIREDGTINTGIVSATAAARAIDGLLAIPVMQGVKCDFNDLHRVVGAEAVSRTIAEAKPIRSNNEMGGDSFTEEWPEPLPLVAKVEAVAYPLDALPDTIRAAVEEVHAFTKAPIPMVASSALASLSVAVQAQNDVKRADKLVGPVSLFLLTIADSGERKSTCDGFFSSPIRDYDQEQAEFAKPDRKRYAAQCAGWKAEHDGLLAAIKQVVKSGKPVNGRSADTLRDDLHKLAQWKPEPPKVPKLMRGDDTPENLAWVLAREWPSAGVITAEAGSVFGSHGMGTDSVMRNMALLNTLWDGGTHTVGRRTSESFTVREARLTMGLQVQETTLRSFFDRSKGLARGTGFLARFLVAWPESTQGSRHFTDPPDAWPSLAAFHRRIAEILNITTKIDEDGRLSPTVLALAPDAKAVWVTFHDVIESELRTGGELHDVRDVASKTADNAARMAALFQVFCSNSSSSTITADRMESASRIAAWHLNESRRFFGELALPSELANPARLDAWLIDYCLREQTYRVPTRTVQQYGPTRLRERAAIEAAMRELESLGRARLVQEGRNKIIQVNLALLSRGEP